MVYRRKDGNYGLIEPEFLKVKCKKASLLCDDRGKGCLLMATLWYIGGQEPV